MIIDFQRQKAVRAKFLQKYEAPAVQQMPGESLDQQQLQTAIDNVLGELPEKTQAIFKLRGIERDRRRPRNDHQSAEHYPRPELLALSMVPAHGQWNAACGRRHQR
jgi:DNA-directed RNA polymerase sigma subunit (sigma70/sigma32)